MGITPRKVKGNVHGIDVDQLDFSGNIYTTVVSRIKIALQADPALIQSEKGGYHVVSSEIIPIGDRFAYRVIIEYPLHSGIYVHGSDFIDMKDNAGLAKAESSAYGRALGLRGIASDDGIASADEVERATIGNSSYSETKPSNGTAAKKETATVSNKPVANTDTSDTNAVDFNLEEKLRLLAERFGYTLMDLNLYATSRGISWHRPSIINLIDALEDHEKAFKVIAHFTKIPFETFQDYVQKTGKTWNIMYTFASNPRRQDFYNAVYPQNTTQQPLSQSNIPAGAI